MAETTKYLDYNGLKRFLNNLDVRYPILDPSQKIPQSYLPSYVDDVLEYTNKASFPTKGEEGKIYVDTTTNLTYRWSGTTYVEISPSLALGETSSTAFRGDLGKTAYEHSQTSHTITILGVSVSTIGGAITATQMKTPLGITALEGYFTNGIANQAAKVSNALTINGKAYDGSSAVSITTPDTDTKNTAGSTQDTSKLFIIGAKTQGANPQTYSNSLCYIYGNKLYSNNEAVLTSITRAMVEAALTTNEEIVFSAGIKAGNVYFGKTPGTGQNGIYEDVNHILHIYTANSGADLNLESDSDININATNDINISAANLFLNNNTVITDADKATASSFGVVKLTNVRTNNLTKSSGGTTGGYYGVESDTSQTLFVNVPAASASSNGIISNTMFTAINNAITKVANIVSITDAEIDGLFTTAVA